jgi:uncharacterized membrane protein YgdD (TMEM256/DUF423 family)
MNKKLVRAASLLGALAVVLGAFGAHALRGRITTEDLGVFETGVRYQFYHVFALLAVALLSERFPGKTLQWAGRCFIAGVLLFSGSLYSLTFLRANGGLGSWKAVGAITPLGGLLLISGWLLLLIAVTRKSTKN